MKRKWSWIDVVVLLVFPLVSVLVRVGWRLDLGGDHTWQWRIHRLFPARYKQGGIRGVADWWHGSATERAMTFMALVLIVAFVILLVASAL